MQPALAEVRSGMRRRGPLAMTRIVAVLLLLLPWAAGKERQDTDHLLAARGDRLSQFYARLERTAAAQYCADRTKLMPACAVCIPGLRAAASGQGDGSAPCTEYIQESKMIRDELRLLTKQRYPELAKDEARAYGLYPYLETPEFVRRQDVFGEMISTKYASAAANIIDIGAYYNPVHLFFRPGYCPTSVIVVEPILDALSVLVPCEAGGINPTGKTHFLFLPVTMKFYVQIKDSLPARPDTVVCIGCDGHYGPSKVRQPH